MRESHLAPWDVLRGLGIAFMAVIVLIVFEIFQIFSRRQEVRRPKRPNEGGLLPARNASP